MTDPVNPAHYKSHPSGIECIVITEHMSFCLGSALKYIWRFESTKRIVDLQKARWYLDHEISRQEKGRSGQGATQPSHSKPDGADAAPAGHNELQHEVKQLRSENQYLRSRANTATALLEEYESQARALTK
jgi:hypothetical protein